MIEDIKPVAEGGNPAPETPVTQPETPQKTAGKGRKPRRSASDGQTEAHTHLSGGWEPEERPATTQVTQKFGEELGEQILDAAAGRRPPFTRSLDPTRPSPETELVEEGERIVGRQQDRGPVHLLPRPLDFKMKPEPFFKYWNMLSQDELDRVKVYVYRLWPITDVNQLLDEEELEKIARHMRKPLSKCLANEDGKPAALKKPLDWEHWREEIYHRWGAGDYSFSLNDTHPAIKKTLCMTNVIGELRDMDTHPPAIDMRILVMKDQGNESYLRWRRLKGLPIPGEYGSEGGGGEDMATTKVLADALVAATKDKQESHNRNGNTPDTMATVAKTVSETIMDSVKTNNQIMLENLKSNNKKEDPAEFLKTVMTVVEKMTPPPPPLPPPNNNKEIVDMVIKSNEAALAASKESNTVIITMLTANLTSLEKRLEAAEKRSQDLQADMMKLIMNRNTPDPNTGNPLISKNPMDMLGEMSKMMTTVLNFADKLSDRNPRGGDGGSVWARIADKVVDVAPNIMHNWAAAQQAMAAIKGVKTTDPQLPPAQGDEDETEDRAPTEEEMALKFLDQIEPPLLHALSVGATGQEFGAILMKSHGADTYEFIAGLSDDQLFTLLRQSQNIWSTVQKMADRFILFLGEFRDRKTVTQVFQRMNNITAQPQAQTPPPPPPAATAAPQTHPATPAHATSDIGMSIRASGKAKEGEAPSQVTRRLKPGQRVVHTPSGQQVVEATATTVEMPSQAPPPPSEPPTAAPASA